MSKYTIKWSVEARNELQMILDLYKFKLKEPNVARRFYKKVLSNLAILEYFPEKHPKVLLNNESYSKFFINNYILFYQVFKESNQVIILHIFHKNQNYLNLL